MAARKSTRSFLIMAIAAAGIAGCAGGMSGTVVTVQPADVAKLAGTWQGTLINVAGVGWPGTLIVRPDGSYTTEGGAFTSQGKAQVSNGKLTFVTSYTSGGLATDDRSGSAVLMDAGSSWRLVGSGHSDRGPFNFDFSKPK